MFPSSAKKQHPLSIRIWHWLNAATILGILGTVLLRKTFLSWRTNGPLIEAKVTELGGAITPDAANAVAKLLRDQMWSWHYTFGYALLGLFLLRIVLAMRHSDQNPVRSTINEFRRYLALAKGERQNGVHKLAVRALYLLFYFSTGFMILSGFSLYFDDSLGLAKDTTEVIKELHEWFMWFFVVFLTTHVGGVVVAELRGERGIVSDMIHGGKPIDGA